MKQISWVIVMVSLTACGDTREEPKETDPRVVEFRRKAVDQQLKDNYDSMLYFINKAIETDSTDYISQDMKLRCLWILDRNEEALPQAKKVAGMGPYNSLYLEGVAYERLGDQKMARGIYQASVDNWPKEYFGDILSFKLQYAVLGTVVYGKQFGLGVIAKVDTSKLTDPERKALKIARRTIDAYAGGTLEELIDGFAELNQK